MIKQFFISFALIAGLLFIGCNKDKDKDNNNDTNDLGLGNVTALDLEKIMNSPFSALTPAQQKVKLEQESISLLNALQDVSSLKAIDVFEYFVDLLDMDEPEVNDPVTESRSGRFDVYTFNASNSYGVFTWNSSSRVWTKSNSSSELKFVFPSGSRVSSNNASMTFKSSDSNASILYEDRYYDERFDIKLPGSVSGILNVDNTDIAIIEIAAEYEKMDKVEIDDETIDGSFPVKNQFRITTEGYVFWYSLDGKGNDSRLDMQLVGKSNQKLIETLFHSDVDLGTLVDEVSDDVDNIFDLDFDVAANGYMKLMDNLVLVYSIDASEFAREIDRIESRNLQAKAYNDALTAAYNRYVKVVLASTEDGFKIADVIYRSEEDRWYNGSYYETDYYISPYLEFGDNSVIEMDTYFSSGFTNLENRWEDFVDAFNR